MVWKKIIPPVFAACIFPYVVTLGWTGRISSQDSGFHGKQAICRMMVTEQKKGRSYWTGIQRRFWMRRST